MRATKRVDRKARIGLGSAAVALIALAAACGPAPAPPPPPPAPIVKSSPPTTTPPTTTPPTTTPPTTTPPTTTPPTTTPPTTTPQGSANAGRVGVDADLFWTGEGTDTTQLQTLAAAGLTWVRSDFYWGTIEPGRGQFNWSNSDGLMAAAAKAGVNVDAILDYSAPWASSDPSGHGDAYYPPSNPADYAQFASAVVGRYGPNGSFWSSRPDVPVHPLAAVEIWNEPWGDWNWKPNPDPVGYGQLVNAAGAAIRTADPGVKILVAGDDLQVRTDGSTVSWIQNLLASDPGIGTYVDAWSVHPYPDPTSNGPNTAGPIDYAYSRVTVTQTDAAAAGVSRPIWITEIGWSTATGTSGAVSEATQSQYLSQALGMALGTWRNSIAETFVYTWDQDGTNPSDLQQHYSLRHADGSYKPAWAAVTSSLTG